MSGKEPSPNWRFMALDESHIGWVPPHPTVERLLDDPERASRGGWAFDASQGFADPVFQAKDLREVYDRSAGGVL